MALQAGPGFEMDALIHSRIMFVYYMVLSNTDRYPTFRSTGTEVFMMLLVLTKNPKSYIEHNS